MRNFTILALVLICLSYTGAQTPDNYSSPGKKIFLKSLICPAWGMRDLKQTTRGRIYLLNDLALIGGYIGFHTRGNWKKQDYRLYAVQHAGITDPDNKPSSFYRDLKFYQSIYEHNLYAGSEIYPDPETYYWEWESDAHRSKYKQIRNSSETAYQTAQFFIGGILLNHIIGAIDAVRIYRRQSGESSSSSTLSKINLSSDFDHQSIRLRLAYPF